MLGAGVVALVLLGAGIVLLGTSKSTPRVSVAHAASVAAAPAAIQPAAASLVLLHISDHGAVRVVNGIVLKGGTLIATTAPISSSASVVVITEAREHINARLVDSDPRTGLGVLQPTKNLPAPPVSSSTASTRTAVALALGESSGAIIRWEHTTVNSLDNPVVVNHVTLGAIRAQNHLDRMPGSILLSPEGNLEAVAVPQLGQHLYLPASLITALVEHMATGLNPTHFALRISAQTVLGKGVRIVAVDPHGPAAGVLFDGDLVVAWNGLPLTCASEFVNALYAENTTQALHLTVVRSGTALQVVVAPVPTS